MKQTNNAIKFLMAQYRAIFKNANIAMVAAIAAAALAAGQAQADTIDSWAKLETVKDADTVEISGSGSVAPNDKVFDITLTQAGNVIKTTDASDAAIFSAKSGSITVKGNGAVLDIGSASASGATVTLGAFAAKEGTVNITGSGDTTSTLSAGTITLGGESGKTAVIDIKAKGVLGVAEATDNTVATTTFDILEGGELKFSAAGGKVGAAGDGVNLSGGKITVEAAATDAEMDSSLKVTAGTVTLADAAGLTVNKGLTVSGGKVAVGSSAAATLTVKGNASFSGADALKIAHADGKLSVNNGNVTFGEGSIATGNAGVVEVTGIEANATKTITVQQGDWANLIKGKLNATGASADTSVLQLNVEGTAAQKELDLAGFTDATAGTFAAFGSNNPKVTATTSKIKFVADHVKFTDGEKYAAGAGIIEAGNLTVGKEGLFGIEDGVVTVKNTLNVTAKADGTQKLTVSGAGVLNLDAANGTSGSVTSKNLVVSGAAAANKSLNIKGTWKTTGGLDIQKGTVTVENGNLTVGGKLNIAATNGKLVGDASVIDATSVDAFTFAGASNVELNNTSTLKLSADKVFTIANDANKTLTVTTNAFAAGAVVANSNSKLSLKTADGKKVSLTEAQYDALLSGTKFNGLFENVVISDLKVEKEMQLSEIKSGQAGLYDKTVVDASNKDIASGSYDVGSVKVSDGSLSLESGASLSLVNASVNGGNFVAGKDASGNVIAADVVLSDKTNGNGLTLGGAGKIGSITTAADGKGALTVGEAASDGSAANIGAVTVDGDIGASDKALQSLTINGSTVSVDAGSVYAQNVDLNGGALSLTNGKELVIGAGAAGLASSIDGAKVEADKLTVKAASTGSLDILGGAQVDVGTLSVTSAVDVVVGDSNAGATVLADKFVFKGGKLVVDPEYGKPASKIVVDNISDTATATDAKIAGDILIGKNSVVSIGYSQTEFDDVMADYLVQNGGFSNQLDGNVKNGVKNALVLNKHVDIASGNGVVIDPEGTTATLTAATADTIDMKAGAALIISDKAFGTDKKEAAIKFLGTTNTPGTITAAQGSKVILVGDFDANDTALKIAVKNNNTAATGVEGLSVEYAGGLLKGTYDAQAGGYKLEFQQDKAGAIYDGISRPVADAIVGKLQGQFKDKNAAGYGLFANLITAENYKAIDAAAHAATYAGAQQAAVAAVTTMADAMFGRVGAVGVEAASISATGSQANGGVWLTPMYKSVDSDGFNAEGASYGADVDLSGVAFGTDTVNGNMRFGAVFNIGSGDAEGKGNGNGLKDEFDYYGFGIYSAMGFGNFALVGDASMTVISHEVEGLGLRGKADTTAVTMGVTGQYTVATPVVDVTPHLGARFIRLNTDSYDLLSATCVEGTTDFDVQNVFSVPLGVTLSKGFVTGGWTLAPSADLTIAFNTGDTEAKSNTFIAGKNIGLNTEVLDEVQYGVTLGLGAQYGAFGTSFGINYTGSSNTDSFGVNAQARYMF